MLLMDPATNPLALIFGALGFGGLVTIGGWVWHLSSKLTKLDMAVTQATLTAEKAEVRCEAAKKDLNRFELEAHRTFASLVSISDFEARLDSKLDRIAQRLDRMIDRHTTGEGSR